MRAMVMLQVVKTSKDGDAMEESKVLQRYYALADPNMTNLFVTGLYPNYGDRDTVVV